MLAAVQPSARWERTRAVDGAFLAILPRSGRPGDRSSARPIHAVEPASDHRSLSGRPGRFYRGWTMTDRSPSPPATGELLITGALLSLYVGLRSGAWAVARLERAVPRR